MSVVLTVVGEAVVHLGRKFAAPETIFGMSERAIKTLSARTGSNWKLTEWPWEQRHFSQYPPSPCRPVTADAVQRT